MKKRIWTILPFLSLVHGSCFYSGVSPPAITGIATPTPLTYTNTITVSGCETDPRTYSDFLTAFVSGTGYPAINPVLVTFSNAGFAYDLFTFLGLIVTLLTPGEYVTMVLSDGYETIALIVSVASPQTVLSTTDSGPTFTTTFAPASKSATLEQFGSATLTSFVPTASAAAAANTGSAGSTSSSSTLPIGGIVGGVIGAVVVVAAMLMFAWYKVAAHRLHTAAVMHSPDERGRDFLPGRGGSQDFVEYPPHERGANQDFVEKDNPNAQEQSHEEFSAPALRYPTETEMGGNLDGDY